MNREDIIRMAQEAGFDDFAIGVRQELLEAFASLVASAEREACLKFCDEVAEYFPSSGFVGSYIGSKIRDRGDA